MTKRVQRRALRGKSLFSVPRTPEEHAVFVRSRMNMTDHQRAISAENVKKLHDQRSPEAKALWKERIAAANAKDRWLITHPDGTEVEVTNLSKYGREHGFHSAGISSKGISNGFTGKRIS